MIATEKTCLSKLMLAIAASGLFLATSSFGQTYTYSFTASPGQSPDLNGSTITIQDNNGTYTVTAFDFIDTPVPGSPFTFSTAGFDADIFSATTSGWDGGFAADDLGGIGLLGVDNSDGLQDGNSHVSVSGLATSAAGNWSYVTPTVPEASSTLVLLFGAIAGTALGGRWLRLQSPAPRR
jgi:hypothetical protein